jgi:hypothetical protein
MKTRAAGRPTVAISVVVCAGRGDGFQAGLEVSRLLWSTRAQGPRRQGDATMTDTNPSSNRPPGRFRIWFTDRVTVFWDNWIAALGSVVVMVAVFLMALLFVLYLYNAIAGHESNPYVDLIGFLVLLAGYGVWLTLKSRYRPGRLPD